MSRKERASKCMVFNVDQCPESQFVWRTPLLWLQRIEVACSGEMIRVNAGEHPWRSGLVEIREARGGSGVTARIGGDAHNRNTQAD